MQKKTINSTYNFFILGSMFLGLFLGSFNSPVIFKCAEISADIFLKLLRLLSLPLIFFSIGSTITSIKSLQIMLSLGSRILYYTILTTIIAASIGLALFLMINPVVASQTEALHSVSANSTTYLQVLANTIPGNIIEPFINNNVIAATFLSSLIAGASLFLPEKERVFTQSFFSTFFAIFLNIAKGVLKLLIPATLSFSILFYKNLVSDQTNFLMFGKYLLCVVGANLIQGIFVLPILLKINRLSPGKIARSMSPALITAFFSKSSSSTLPLTMELAENELKIEPSLARLSFPLCSIINMNGCAAFILITVLFVATSHGVVFSPLSLLGWIFIATLCAIGNAGVPMGCFFLTSSLISSMQLPLYLLGLILSFYTLLDMIETALNVWSDCCVVSLVNKRFSNKSIALDQ